MARKSDSVDGWGFYSVEKADMPQVWIGRPMIQVFR